MHQFAAHHPQIGQRKQRDDLCRVLLQAPIANLHKSKLPLDHPKRVLDLGTNTCLELFCLINQRIGFVVLIELFALARSHGDVLEDISFSIRALFNALVACVAKAKPLLPVQQAVCLGDIADIARGAAHGVHQARLGIHCGADLQEQATRCQKLIDGLQDLPGKLVCLQPVPESKDGGLIWQAAKLLKLGKLPVQRGVKESFFHGGVRQGEPLLYEVRAQHGLKTKRWSAGAPSGVVGCDPLDQRCPGHNLIHLLQKTGVCGFS